MRSLGKIIAILIVFSHALYAKVEAKLDFSSVELGDSVTLSLLIDGKDIKDPQISQICNSDILSTSSQTSIQMINGSYAKQYILSYKFEPKASCEIEPITVEVDGKAEKSNALKVEVKPQSSANDGLFTLLLETQKSELFVGEPFDVTLTFKQRRDAEAVDSKFIAPDLKGFWLKGETQPVREQAGGYAITKITYTLAPQREGNLSIPAAVMKIASRINARDSFGMWIPQIKWKSYYSNELKIHAKPLPGGVTLVGDFGLKVSAQRQSVNAGEAFNLSVEVQGDGNLEDIKSFKPAIAGVNVFDEKIDINGSVLTQKLAFVADSDFTIPSFELRFYDPKAKSIKRVASEPINVRVINNKPKEPLKIQRGEAADEDSHAKGGDEVSLGMMIVLFLAGAASGAAGALLWSKRDAKEARSFRIDDEKSLMIKLMPYRDDAEVKLLLERLEAKLYGGSDEKIDKKAVKTLLKKYNIVAGSV
ncbi:MAG: BatD family protein [Epsilonproteobacteria bacterium]|nr:BatD family protein [Campylobacterota bacterium]